MPSGSKKRKAAKKKKSHHHTHNHNSSRENDEHKSQDERDTDGGEVSSPASHDVQVHPFDDGNSGSDPSPDQSPVAQNESAFAKEEVALKEELKDDAKIEEEVKSEGDWEVKEVGIELVDSATEVNANDGPPPHSSSLDNMPIEEKSVEKAINCESETTSYENKPTEVTTNDTESATFTQTDDNLIIEPLSVVDGLNSAVPVSEEVVEVLESASVENSAVLDAAGSALNGNAEKSLAATDDDIKVLQAATTNVEASENNENKVSLSSIENNAVPVFEVVESAPMENSAAFDAAGSVNAEKLLPAATDDDIEILQAATTDVEASENNENKVSLSSNENNVAPAFVVVESASMENSADFYATGSVSMGNAEKLLLAATDDDIEILQAAMTNVEAIDNNENKVSLLSKEIVGASLESVTNEKEGLKLPDALSDIMDVAPTEIKGKTSPVLEENIVGVSSNLVESATSGAESTSLMSSEAPSAAVTSRGTENIKYSETEPLVAPAPRVVRKTSWLNCCGIFDVLSGSSR